MNRLIQVPNVLLALLCAVSASEYALGQAVSEVPRPEYYIARDLYEAGRVLESSDGFRIASSRSLRIGEQPWIDSIPPLVLMGECYYAQGKLALAMEQYDAALMIALAFPQWLDQVRVATELTPIQEPNSKAVNWFPSPRKTQILSYPELVQLTADVGAGQAGTGGAAVVTNIDTAEVLRTMAIAVARRGEILGPLAKHSPLAQPLDQLFSSEGKQPNVWLNGAWGVLRGLHAMQVTSGVDAGALLRENSVLNNAFDYFMTPIAFVALAKLEIDKGKLTGAIPFLQEATLSAGQQEQYSQLAETLSLLAGVCTAGNRIDLLPGLQAAAAWGNKRSASVQACGFAGAAELAAAAGNLAAADTLCKQAASALRTVALPRAQAQLAYASASVAFAENRTVVGTQQLETALTIMRGNAQDGAAVATIFQAQMVLDLLQADALTVADAEQALTVILQEPGAQQWQTAPLDTIAAMTTSAVPVYALWLELAERRGTKEQVIERMDRLQRQRFYESLPLGGRLFNWRQAVLGQSQQPQQVRDLVAQTLLNTPSLASNTQQLIGLAKQLRQMPSPLDERQPSTDAKKRFSEFQKAVELQESQLLYQSLQRKPLDRFTPFVASLPQLQSSLDEDDLLLSWAGTSDKFYGAAITKHRVETWSTADVAIIEEQLKMLLGEIGLSAIVRPQKPADDVDLQAAWRGTTHKLLAKLLPDNIQKLIAGADRILAVPDGSLWYLPFELLPNASKNGTWLAEHAISYLPTLGSLPLADRPSAVVDRTVLVSGSFFAADKAGNDLLTNAIIQGLPKAQKIDLAAKNNLQSALWLRLDIDQLLVCAKIESVPKIWETSLFPLDATKFSQLGSWIESPQQVPSRLIFPGYQTNAATSGLGSGRELMVPACSLLYSGAQSALISRWPVAGRSSQIVMNRYVQELEFESPSAAWQRAAFSLWAEELLVAEEPAMLPTSKDSPTLVRGQHPKLWSSYLIIGDTRPPQATLP